MFSGPGLLAFHLKTQKDCQTNRNKENVEPTAWRVKEAVFFGKTDWEMLDERQVLDGGGGGVRSQEQSSGNCDDGMKERKG